MWHAANYKNIWPFFKIHVTYIRSDTYIQETIIEPILRKTVTYKLRTFTLQRFSSSKTFDPGELSVRTENNLLLTIILSETRLQAIVVIKLHVLVDSQA
ncbi:hypothetical protein B5X24_HaOG206463 [Helicoverpa armigera]|uniref:Uncharacterized protein n=1 Tax=Helicoverpa armigera TaxID=29058 RepID=A0A2W1BNW2_HELAM|nr:hypothetical protein B5X24_HaOG206463 [Helicoverpa armigera]